MSLPVGTATTATITTAPIFQGTPIITMPISTPMLWNEIPRTAKTPQLEQGHRLSPPHLRFSVDEFAALRSSYHIERSVLFPAANADGSTFQKGSAVFMSGGKEHDAGLVEMLEGEVDGYVACTNILTGEDGEAKCEWLITAAEASSNSPWSDTIKHSAVGALVFLGIASVWAAVGGLLLKASRFGRKPHLFAIECGAWLWLLQQAHRKQTLRGLN